MDSIVGNILKGTPTAFVVAILYLFFQLPLSNRIELLATELNREILPVLNALEKKSLPNWPPVRDLLAESSGSIKDTYVAAVDPSSSTVFIFLPRPHSKLAIPLNVNSTSRIISVKGEAQNFSDLRAGEEVYEVKFSRQKNGAWVVNRINLGKKDRFGNIVKP